jgi:putative phosphoribosyl transferase
MAVLVMDKNVQIGPEGLAGDLVMPREAKGVVLFAHGSGSSRLSPRNRYVAEVLQQGGFGTLLLDLLTSAEEQVDARTGHFRFDIELLTQRLVAATEWMERQDATGGLPIGYFGASTGAAAALEAAESRPHGIRAVVSRGGRPDLAGASLAAIQAPTLLIVGGEDRQVIELNRKAFAALRCEKRLTLVPGATHLFEEPGALQRVARLAADWFLEHVPGGI